MTNDDSNLQIIRDLTYRLTLRDADVFEDHKLFRLLQESTGDGYWDWDIVKGIKYMSPSYKKQLGYSPEEIQNLADGDGEMVDCGSLELAKESVEQHIFSKGTIPYSSIMKYKHKEGHDVWILCRGSVVEWDGDVPLRMVGTHVDITLTIEKIKKCCNG